MGCCWVFGRVDAPQVAVLEGAMRGPVGIVGVVDMEGAVGVDMVGDGVVAAERTAGAPPQVTVDGSGRRSLKDVNPPLA